MRHRRPEVKISFTIAYLVAASPANGQWTHRPVAGHADGAAGRVDAARFHGRTRSGATALLCGDSGCNEWIDQGQPPIFPGRGPRAPGTGCPRPRVPSGQTPECPPRLPAARHPTAMSLRLLEEFRHRLDDDPRGDFRPVHEPSEVLPVAGQEMSRLASDRRFKDRAILLR